MNNDQEIQPPGSPFLHGADGRIAVFVFLFSSAIVAAAAMLASHWITPRAEYRRTSETGLSDRLTTWDGNFYADIATNGFLYPGSETELPTIAFFPAYPLLAEFLTALTGLPIRWSLLLVSHLSLATGIGVLWSYLRRRWQATSDPRRAFTLLAFGLFPTSFYFHVGYSEALFVALAILAMHAMEREWRPGMIAAIIGLATATRLVGLALLIPFAMYLSACARENAVGKLTTTSLSRFGATIKRAGLFALSLWGLIAFLLFQWSKFGTPFAFAYAQLRFHARRVSSVFDLALPLLSLEPIRAAYEPGPFHWSHLGPENLPWLNWRFLAPIYFVTAVGLVWLGWDRGWTTRREVALSITLLIIPYLTTAYGFGMISHARFASVAFPNYLVIGELLARAPRQLAYIIVASFTALMAVYAAMFSSFYPLW